jgi:hypothetical protein
VKQETSVNIKRIKIESEIEAQQTQAANPAGRINFIERNKLQI